MKVFASLRGVGLFIVLSALGVGGRAFADADAPTAVLGLEALDGAPDNVASEITDALRQRVASTHGFELVQGKDLVEVKLVFSCPDEGVACMAQAAKSMGATKLIYGNVKRTGVDYQITLKLLDANRSTVESWVTEAIPRRKADPSAFRALAPAWMAKLTGKGAVGTLQIRANVTGATVSLDGTRVGVTGTDAVAVPDVSPGRHEVVLEKSGYATARQEFTLAASQSLPLSLSLTPVSVDVGAAAPAPSEDLQGEPVIIRKPREAPEEPSSSAGSSTARMGFWVAIAGTTLATAGGLYFGKKVQQINSDLDPYRRIEAGTKGCSASPTGLCGIDGKPAPPLDAHDSAVVSSKKSDGQRDEILEAVLLITAAPLAIASGYFLYKGYLDSGSSGSHTVAHGLRIFPTASASAGGIVTEFDF